MRLLEEVSRGGHWRRPLEEVSRGGCWRRLLEEVTGGGRWRRLLDEYYLRRLIEEQRRNGGVQ